MKSYQSVGRTAFFIAAIALMSCSVLAQIPGVTVLPPQLNNPSPYLSDWQSRASTAIVIVINTSSSSFSAKIWVEFFLNGSRVAYSQPAKLPSTLITNKPPNNVFNGEQLVPLSSVKFENSVDQNSQRAGRIPDGQVCLRVHVLNIQTGQESVSPDGCSIILSYSPPQLILPENNSELCRLGYDNVVDRRNNQPVPLFQWTPIVPAAQMPVTYHFAIYEVLAGQAPIAAFRGAYALFQRDLTNLTNLLWPTEYFLPQLGKTYVWSVRALDDRGNPFVLTNDSWATPFTFTVLQNCDQSGSGNIGGLLQGIAIAPQIIDFGSVRIGTTSDIRQVTITNNGSNLFNIQTGNIVSISNNSGFSISTQPDVLVIPPAVSSTFNVVFKPGQLGMADGSVRIASDAGPITIILKGQGVDNSSPTITIQSPQGGDNLTPGTPFPIKFTASDNNALTNYVITFSTDGGASFTNTIIPADNSTAAPPAVIWSISPGLQTTEGIIKITALDRNGNPVSGLSGLFSIGGIGGQNGNPGGDQNNGSGSGLNSSGLSGNSSNGGTDSKSRNTNLTDVYVMGEASLNLEGNLAGWIHSMKGGNQIADSTAGGKYEDISLLLMPTTDDIYKWIKASLNHDANARKSGELQSVDFKRDIRQIREFTDADISEIVFPGSDGSSKDPAYLTIKFTPGKISSNSDTGKAGSPPDVNQKIWLPANFKLHIDGLDCSKVSKIDAFKIKQNVVPPNIGTPNTNSADCSQIANSIIGSDEYRKKEIGDLYQKYLSRSVDPVGLNAYLGFLKSGGKLEQVIIGILGSPEYFITKCSSKDSAFISQIYQDLLGRPADAASSIFLNALNNSSQTRAQIVAVIMGSQEYLMRVIQNLFQTYLGRTPSPVETSLWIGIMQGGKGSDFVLADIVGSQEYQNKNSSGDCVSALYQLLLGRPADAAAINSYEKEPAKIDLPNLKISVPAAYAHDFDVWHEDFVKAGSNKGSKQKSGSLTYLNGDGKSLITLTFRTAGIFKRSADALENNSDKIRRVTYELYLENIDAKFTN